MTDINPVLARKLGLAPHPPAAEDAPAMSATRQMRRALARAADGAVGLSASVLGIEKDVTDAEALIEGAPDGWIVLGLRDGANAGLTGLLLLDPALRSALVEMQTMGHLLPPQDTPRAVTRTDAVLSMPFADLLLKELAAVDFCADRLDCASYDMGPMADLRTAGLVMMQGEYLVWRITIELGGHDTQGELMIALRPVPKEPAPVSDGAATWSADLHKAVGAAPADLDAVLARMTLPFSKIDAFEVGQLLPLAGTTVGSISLRGPEGRTIAQARLGQVAGMRAVRIETAKVDLQEVTPPGARRTTGPAISDATEDPPPVPAEAADARLPEQEDAE